MREKKQFRPGKMEERREEQTTEAGGAYVLKY